MINLCEAFGVEELEEFEFEGKGNNYRVKKNILEVQHYVANTYWEDSGMKINDIVNAKIVKKPFKPKDGEDYWFARVDCRCTMWSNWDGDTTDLMFLSNGMVYRTKEEAEKYGIPKMIELKKSLGIE